MCQFRDGVQQCLGDRYDICRTPDTCSIWSVSDT